MNERAIIPFRPASASVTDQVFTSLYDAVVSLRLPPGTKVSESEVAKQLDVSRQPVRDAFFRLSNLGFLLIRPQRATLITRISEQAVRDAVFMRTALELACLREAVRRATADDVAGLRAILREQGTALGPDDAPRFQALDEAMHKRMCAVAGHPHVWTVILEHKAHLDRIRFLTLSGDRRQQVLVEHGGVVDAVEAGDAALAEARLRMHLESVLDVLPAMQAASPEYFEPES